MDHTLVKGRQNVETEYRIAALCYNLTRLVSIVGIEGLRKKLEKVQKGLFELILHLCSWIAHHDIKMSKICIRKRRMPRALNMAYIGPY